MAIISGKNEGLVNGEWALANAQQRGLKSIARLQIDR
jgi:hypothetical protein